MKRSVWMAGRAVGICLSIGACAGAKRVPPEAIPNQPCNADRVLSDVHRIRSLPETEIEGEVRTAEKAFSDSGEACDRFRLAALLLFPESRFRDVTRAYGLLEDYAQESGGGAEGLGALGELLLSAAESRWECENRQKDVSRRLEDAMGTVEVLSRTLDEERRRAADLSRNVEEEKRRAEALSRKLDEEKGRAETMGRRMEEERARAENLKRQLDGLKDIERIMNERQKK